MSPCEGVARTEPGDDDDEDTGQQHLGGVERRLDAGHPVPHLPHLLRLARVPAQERVLAADAAQHPQPRDGVGAEPDEPAGLLALVGLALLERPDDEGEEGGDDRYADEDDETESARRAEQDDRDDDVATTAPTNRAKTSYRPPIRIASEATTATTSPVGIWRGRASPTSALCQPTSWIERKAARSQLFTANQCRPAPASALTTPSPTRTPHQRTSWSARPATMPWSMARLIAAGKSAWVTIHTTPNAVATARVRHWPRPTQPRKLRGLRRSGVPGCSYGRRTRIHRTREI